MKLKQKITVLVTGILLLVMISVSILSFREMKKLLIEKIGEDLLRVAETITMMETVQYNIGKPEGMVEIQDLIEKTRLKTGLPFIVVMDMNGTRYSHPLEEKIGQRFEGGDEEQVLKTGERYLSKGSGSLGPSLRAFVPLFYEGEQVGAVSVGVLIGELNEEIYTKLKVFIPILIVGLLLGVAGASILSFNIKRTILGLEPEEIARILKEKEAVLEGVKEGILAVDKNGNITVFNKEAVNILGLNKEDIGCSIGNYTYGSMILEVLKSGELLENVETKIKTGVAIMCKYNPLKNEKSEIIGVVVSFENLTEVKKMAEELTGAKNMAWSLRAQNHEFMNRLHTISGLIQLEEYEAAVSYISNVASSRSRINTILTDRIKDVSINALLLAKYNKAEEAKISLQIQEDSFLNELPDCITCDELGSVIGNILENSMDAVKNDGTGIIKFRIYEKEGNLNIYIKNNGCEIPHNIRADIYKPGITTKEGMGGYGMYVVKKIVEEAQGQIAFTCSEGTEWSISIPMKRG